MFGWFFDGQKRSWPDYGPSYAKISIPLEISAEECCEATSRIARSFLVRQSMRFRE